MKLNKIIFVVVAILVAFSFTLSSNLRTEEIAAIGLFVFFLLNFIDSIGKSYNLLDIPILLALFQCMLMPAIVFHVYNEDAMVIALKYDMGVSAEVYYAYMFPAVIALIAGLKLPELLQTSYHLKFIKAVNESRSYLVGKGNIGILLIIIGFVAGFLQIFIPGDLQYVAYLFGKLLYVGVLYTYFSDAKNRKWYLIGGIVAVVANSLAQAMFGELVYLLALSVMLVLLGRKITNTLKYSIAIVGFIFVVTSKYQK